jgi:hypothetical protein
MVANRQRGMSMWSTMFVVGVLAFFLFVLFKLIPPYLEDMKVTTALDSLLREPSAETMGKADLVERLDKRFDIDNVTNVKAKQLEIKPMGKLKAITLNYEVVVPLFYNVSLLLEFNHARQVRSTAE